MSWLYTGSVVLSPILCLARWCGSAQLRGRFWMGSRSSGFLSVPGSPGSSRPSLTRTLPLLVGWPGDMFIPQGQHAGALKPTICGHIVVVCVSWSPSLPLASLLWGFGAGYIYLPLLPPTSARGHLLLLSLWCRTPFYQCVVLYIIYYILYKLYNI